MLNRFAQVLFRIRVVLPLLGCAGLVIILPGFCCRLQLLSWNCGTVDQAQWRKEAGLFRYRGLR
jgi:hypothetical protein